MKKAFQLMCVFVLATVTFFVGYFANQPQNSLKSKSKLSSVVYSYANTDPTAETVVRYSQFQGMPVELVTNHSFGTVVVRIRLANDKERSEATLNFLKSEVERFVAAKGPVQLGDNGLSFHFDGGMPIWSPHDTWMGYPERYTCIQFAENASINDGVIIARGQNEVKGFYPYALVKN